MQRLEVLQSLVKNKIGKTSGARKGRDKMAFHRPKTARIAAIRPLLSFAASRLDHEHIR
jgi:hypothetical protein